MNRLALVNPEAVFSSVGSWHRVEKPACLARALTHAVLQQIAPTLHRDPLHCLQTHGSPDKTSHSCIQRSLSCSPKAERLPGPSSPTLHPSLRREAQGIFQLHLLTPVFPLDLAWLFLEYDPFSSLPPPPHPQPDYDVWILLTVVGTIFVIILASVLRIRCRPHHSRPVSGVGRLLQEGLGTDVQVGGKR